MNFHVTFQPGAQGLLNQPILLAAIITFCGVLLTVIIGTFANFRLAQKRNEFEQSLAAKKLADEISARTEARIINAKIRRIDFQRATLIELQECMLELLRTANSRLQSGNDENDMMKNKSRDLNARTALLLSRIDDDEISLEAQAIKSKANGVGATSDEDRQKALDEGTFAMVPFLNRIGARIKELDRDEAHQAGNKIEP